MQLLSQPRTQTQLVPRHAFGLLPRLIALAILFAAEALTISVWLDNSALSSRSGLAGFVGLGGAWTVRGVIGFAAIFLTFAYLKSRDGFARISDRAQQVPLNRGFLVAHFGAMAAFGALSWALYGNRSSATSADWFVILWLAAGASGIVFGAFSFIPLVLWVRLVRETGWLGVYALVAVVSACAVGRYSEALWMPTAHLTFSLVKVLLRPFVAGIVTQPATLTLGTAKFMVEIAPSCSGLEGVGLILGFGIMWLCLFRRECRFPQALILLPAGVTAIFLLNAVRLAVLILIGIAGAPQVAMGGFHSQAGWIGFNAVALGFSVAARRVPWLSATEQPAGRADDGPTSNPTAAYLAPFLCILAAGILTRAASSDFEWLYPLRFVAAAVALWLLRKRYVDLDWRFGWFGPAIGIVVFAMWIVADRFLNRGLSDALPRALMDASPSLRVTWIAFRVLSATVTVPIAEELAFRAFLLRRLISPDFETLPLRTFTWLGLGISSIAFGLLHGNMWFAALLGGVLYAWAMIRRGRIGDAVVAHATTNALLACYVLMFRTWHLWS